jgi:EcsC protein family
MDASQNMGGNACAGLDPVDRQKLQEAAEMLVAARGLITKITEAVGNIISRAGGTALDLVKEKVGLDVRAKAGEVTESVLRKFQSGAMTGLDEESDRERWNWFHKLVVGASGATGGFFGAPGLLWDLPITTGVIMRSIADIARSFPGENLSSEATKRACIEVFAFGGPESDDDDADAGYWITRSGLSHVTIELLIRQVTARFGVVLSEKILTQAVPVAGMLAGAGLNYAFIDYYQQMARVHFTIRDVERRPPDLSAVRPCFSHLVREVRRRRKPQRSRQEPAAR